MEWPDEKLECAPRGGFQDCSEGRKGIGPPSEVEKHPATGEAHNHVGRAPVG